MTDDVREQLAKDLLGEPYEGLSPVQRSVIDLIATEATRSASRSLGLRSSSFSRGSSAVGASVAIRSMTLRWTGLNPS